MRLNGKKLGLSGSFEPNCEASEVSGFEKTLKGWSEISLTPNLRSSERKESLNCTLGGRLVNYGGYYMLSKLHCEDKMSNTF